MEVLRSGVDELCGGPLWDHNLTWHSKYPDLTPCFQNTLLIWVPCLFLWIWGPIYKWLVKGCDRKPLDWNKLNSIKTVLAFTLLCVTLLDAGKTYSEYTSSHSEHTSLVYLVSAVVRAATMLLVLQMIQWDRQYAVYSNAGLFLFWFLYTVATTIITYSFTLRAYTLPDGSHRPEVLISDRFRYSTSAVQAAVSALCLLISCFADVPPELKANKKIMPEVYASFVCQLTVSWFNDLFKLSSEKKLELDDFWSMRPADQVKNYAPGFLELWYKKLSKVRRDENLHCNGSKKVENGSVIDDKPNDHLRQRNGSSLNDSNSEKQKSDVKSKENVSQDKQKNEEEMKNFAKTPSLLFTIIQCFGQELFFLFVLFVLMKILEQMDTQIASFFLGYIDSDRQLIWKGVLCSLLFLLHYMLFRFVFEKRMWMSQSCALRIRGALISAIYRKSLTVSNQVRSESVTGKLVNIMSGDTNHVRHATQFLMFYMILPFQLMGRVCALWHYIGYCALVAPGLMILSLPLTHYLVAGVTKARKENSEIKDQKIKVINDALNGMKVLKLYAWEIPFEKKIEAIRQKQLSIQRKISFWGAAIDFTFHSIPLMVSLATLAAYMYTSENAGLDARQTFMCLLLIDSMRFPIHRALHGINTLSSLWVSVRRIEKFLGQEDISEDVVIKDPDALHAVTMENGTFSWNRALKPTLKNINLAIDEGSLVAVVGLVGAGKSSLVSALLGEMEKIDGVVTVKSSTAYTSQQAWIQNATIEKNILFGSERDEKKYQKVLDACALRTDLDILDGGDQCEIGEKGVNLSGGQKQRVSLARAVYNDADIYYLDDPLSAVDAHVGKHIFEEVIGNQGLLGKKTRILVTHGIQWLPHADSIIVMDDGAISEMGTYQELISHNGAFANFVKTHANEERSDFDVEADFLASSHSSSLADHLCLSQRSLTLSQSFGSTHSEATKREKRSERRLSSSGYKFMRSLSGSFAADFAEGELDVSSDDTDYEELLKDTPTPREKKADNTETDKKKEDGKLTDEEDDEVGIFRWSALIKFMKAFGTRLVIGLIALCLFAECLGAAQQLWLPTWLNDDVITNISLRNTTLFADTQRKNLLTYGLFGLGDGVVSAFFILWLTIAGVHVAGLFHSNLLNRILKAPMKFFDTTPTGRLLNRFSHDMEKIDELKYQVKDFLFCIFFCLSTFCLLSYSMPWFLVFVPAIILYYNYVRQMFKAAGQFFRLERTTSSPILSHFSESLNGASTIRAFAKQDHFIAYAEDLQQKNHNVILCIEASYRWLGVRIESITAVICCLITLMCVFDENMTVASAGMVMQLALRTVHCFFWATHMFTHFGESLVSVERVLEYSAIQTEAAWALEDKQCDENWPTEGAIEFQDFSVRYREGLDLVLKHISCRIKPKEKIGIVGRTGAGKSSLTMSLFRVIEAAGGCIKIDGVNIAKLGLHDLRSKLTILPQDPVLFSGTLRSNIDPFDIHTTERLWTALEHSHLKDFVSQLPDGLSYEVGEGGINLSVGQRQLVCLARSLLKKTKILVLDEATAAVDLETDDLIQKTIRVEFKDCTILTIAHRLKTIMDSDKVLVLDQGRITEFDNPKKLLQNTESTFYSMAKDAGIVA